MGPFEVQRVCSSSACAQPCFRVALLGLSPPVSQGDLVGCWCLAKLCLFNKRTAQLAGGAQQTPAASCQGSCFSPPSPAPLRMQGAVGPEGRPQTTLEDPQSRGADRPTWSLPGCHGTLCTPGTVARHPDTDTRRGCACPQGWLLSPSAVTKHLSVTAPASNSGASAAWRPRPPGAPGGPRSH